MAFMDFFKSHRRKLLSVTAGLLIWSLLIQGFFSHMPYAAAGLTSVPWADYLAGIWAEKSATWNWTSPPSGTPRWDGTAVAPQTTMEGTKKVYLITTPQELYWTRANFTGNSGYIDAEIRLMNNIDMGGAVGQIWTPYSSNFKGEFNGRGNTIFNLYVSRPASENNGLFSFTASSSNIHDLVMVSPKVVGKKYNGALVGMDYGVVKNIRVEKAWIQIPLDSDWGSAIVGYCNTYGLYDGLAAVDSIIYGGSHLGSVVGMPRKIQNSYAIGCTVISTGYHSGGFMSCTDYLQSVKNCYSDCEVYGTRETGAFLGYSTNAGTGGTAIIENCFAQGSVEGVQNIGGFAPGFQGYSGGITVRDCYSTAIVGMRDGGTSIGSFTGISYSNVRFQNCYAAGEVGGLENNTDIGGFIGVNNGATFSNCYYDKQTTAMREVAAGVGSAAGITGLLTNSDKGGGGQKMTGHELTGFSPSIWKFEDQLYPQLHIFADADSVVFPDGNMNAPLNRATGAAYSAASVATPILAPWENVPIDTSYDTVRDITVDFPFAQNSNHVIVWSNKGKKGVVEPNKDVLTVYNGGKTAHVNTVGIEWVYATHTATISGISVTAVRPIRLIPTRSLYAGEDKVKNAGETYDNWEDVTLINSTALELDRHIQTMYPSMNMGRDMDPTASVLNIPTLIENEDAENAYEDAISSIDENTESSIDENTESSLDESTASSLDESTASSLDENMASSASEHIASSTSEHIASSASEHIASSTSEHTANNVSAYIESSASEHIASSASEHIASSASEHIASSASEYIESSIDENGEENTETEMDSTSLDFGDAMQIPAPPMIPPVPAFDNGGQPGEIIVPLTGQDARALVENGNAPSYTTNSPTIVDQDGTIYDYFGSADVYRQFNGSQTLPAQYGGKVFTITYVWLLSDGRFLTDDKQLEVISDLVVMHIRQVVVNRHSSVVPLPQNGYMTLDNQDVNGTVKSNINVICASGNNQVEYTNFYFGIAPQVEDFFAVNPIIPQNYQYAGNFVSYSTGSADFAQAATGAIKVDYTTDKEVWITVYIEPITEEPGYYEWDSAVNDFGKIQLPPNLPPVAETIDTHQQD